MEAVQKSSNISVHLLSWGALCGISGVSSTLRVNTYFFFGGFASGGNSSGCSLLYFDSVSHP